MSREIQVGIPPLVKKGENILGWEEDYKMLIKKRGNTNGSGQLEQ